MILATRGMTESLGIKVRTQDLSSKRKRWSFYVHWLFLLYIRVQNFACILYWAWNKDLWNSLYWLGMCVFHTKKDRGVNKLELWPTYAYQSPNGGSLVSWRTKEIQSSCIYRQSRQLYWSGALYSSGNFVTNWSLPLRPFQRLILRCVWIIVFSWVELNRGIPLCNTSTVTICLPINMSTVVICTCYTFSDRYWNLMDSIFCNSYDYWREAFLYVFTSYLNLYIVSYVRLQSVCRTYTYHSGVWSPSSSGRECSAHRCLTLSCTKIVYIMMNTSSYK